MERQTWWFEGRVQGVGFRATVHGIAKDYPVCGFVENRPDGRVRAVVEGTSETLAELLAAIRRRMEGFVSDCRIDVEPARNEYIDFSIHY